MVWNISIFEQIPKQMRNILTAVFLLCSFASFSREEIFVSKDSLLRFPNYLDMDWKLTEGDDSSMAMQSYDDSKWKVAKTILNLNDNSTPSFKGIGWFRLHFTADTTVSGRPLAMSITHYGASEIFLDGKLINAFGKIDGPDNTEYEDPQELPFVFTIPDPGEHVLAVRYANFKAEKNNRVYKISMAGFKLMLGETDILIFHKNLKEKVLSVIMLLAGIFLALSFLHLFMYLYHRTDRSNLYFSVFMFCLSAGFLIVFISYAFSNPSTELNIMYPRNFLFCIGCISLSGFTNELFAKTKTRFRIIAALGIIIIILRFLNYSIFGLATIGLVGIVSLEVVIMVIYSIIKKIKGAKIIGGGIFLFALFILTVFGIAIVRWGNFDINDSTTEGRIFLFFFILALLSIPFSMSIYQAWRFAGINKDLSLQLEQIKLLSKKTLEQAHEKQLMLENRKEELEKEVQLRTSELQAEKKKSDDLLLNILPSETAEELKATGESKAKHFVNVTVMFTDFKNFTQASEKLSAEELVKEINYCYSNFDEIISRHGIEKIKTIGDSYMCAGGLPVPNMTHASDIIKAGIEMQEFIAGNIKARSGKGLPFFELRIGVHTGPVVAGIVGIKKFAYDIWGDTVNTASRMESSGEVGKINMSGTTYELVKDKFTCTHRGKIQAKNKGEIDMYFIEPVITLM